MTKTLDPLYGSECEMSDVLPDETMFCRLFHNERLSYYIHKSLLDCKRMCKLMRGFNDEYHNSNNAKEDYLSFCIVETIYTKYTSDSSKHYVFIDNLGKNRQL